MFPSDRLAERQLAATTAGARSWKGATLFAIVFAGLWFLLLDAGNPDSEPGSFRATTFNAKRTFIDWIHGETPDASNDRARGAKAWLLDNVNGIPCALGALCDVQIRFASGETEAFLVERPNFGDAKLSAISKAGADLLNRSTDARLMVPEPGADNRSVVIARKPGGGWSVVDRTISTNRAVPTGRTRGATR